MEINDLLERESESSSEDDENAELLTEELEEGFLKVLSKLKKKDNSVYDKNVTFYPQSVEENISGNKKSPLKGKKEMLKKWLEGKKDKVQDETLQQELEGLHEFWANPKLNKDDTFLRDYILGKKFLEEDKDFDLEKALQTLDSEEEEIKKQLEFEEKFNLRFENNQNQEQGVSKQTNNKQKKKMKQQQKNIVNEGKPVVQQTSSTEKENVGAPKKKRKKNKTGKQNVTADSEATKILEEEAPEETLPNTEAKVSKAEKKKAKRKEKKIAKKLEKKNSLANGLSTSKRKINTTENKIIIKTEEPLIKKQKMDTETKGLTKKENKKNSPIKVDLGIVKSEKSPEKTQQTNPDVIDKSSKPLIKTEIKEETPSGNPERTVGETISGHNKATKQKKPRNRRKNKINKLLEVKKIKEETPSGNPERTVGETISGHNKATKQKKPRNRRKNKINKLLEVKKKINKNLAKGSENIKALAKKIKIKKFNSHNTQTGAKKGKIRPKIRNRRSRKRKEDIN